MLNNGKLPENFCIIHLDHAFVDFRPTGCDARNVKQNGAVFPESAFLDVANKADGCKVEIVLPLLGHNYRFGNVRGLGSVRMRAFLGQMIPQGDRGSILS